MDLSLQKTRQNILGLVVSIVIIAMISCIALLSACTTTQQTSVTTALQKLQVIAQNGCAVVQPTLASVAALDPAVGVAATANGLFCATVDSISVASIQSLISTGIPSIESAVQASTLIPAAQKPVIIAAIGVFSLTLTNALATYTNALSTAPASAAVATPASS